MQQSKMMSLIEAVGNTLIGLVIAYFAQAWFLAYMDVQITAVQNWSLVLFMTLVSIVRSYVLRRIFNHRSMNNDT